MPDDIHKPLDDAVTGLPSDTDALVLTMAAILVNFLDKTGNNEVARKLDDAVIHFCNVKDERLKKCTQ